MLFAFVGWILALAGIIFQIEALVKAGFVFIFVDVVAELSNMNDNLKALRHRNT